MRLSPTLAPIAVANGVIRRRPVAGVLGKKIPDGVLPLAQADFDDLSIWTLDAEWTAAAGAVSKVTGALSRYVTSGTISIPAGDVWVGFSLRDATTGTLGAQLQNPFRNNPFSTKLTAQHVTRFSSSAHTKVRLSASPTFNGTVDDMQIVDMTAILAQPADIYIAAGQSLIAAETSGGPVDLSKDFWVPRCLYMPSFTNSALGSVAGEIHACIAPLQMSEVSTGVSPATSFAREIEKSTAAGRSVMILACADGGTKLVGTSAEWNPAATVGTGASAYNNMIARAQAALALRAGNQIKGMIWGQGESDRSGTMGTNYPPAFQAMLAQARSTLGVPNLPVILIGPEPDDADTNQALFILTQQRLDAASGHSTATAHVHYVARPTGYLSGDGTHPVAEGHRIAGRAAAAKFIAKGYL